MTVTTTIIPRTSYPGDDVEDELTIAWVFLDEDHVVVVHEAADETQTLMTQDAAGDYGYTISGSTITLNTATATGAQVIVYRNTPITQEVDFTKNRRFNAETEEEMFDRLTLICQELRVDIDRALVLLSA